MDFDNEKDLLNYMDIAMNAAYLEVQEKMINALHNSVEEYTYSNNNFWYERTGGFRDSFEWQGIVHKNGEIIKEIVYNWQSLTHAKGEGAEKGVYWGHYNNKADNTDIRKDLARMMNVNGEVGGKDREPFWDIWEKQMIKDMDIWFTKAFAKYGIKK